MLRAWVHEGRSAGWRTRTLEEAQDAAAAGLVSITQLGQHLVVLCTVERHLPEG